MQKITPRYLMWKVIICFLTQIMAAAVGIPFLMIAKANELDGNLTALLLTLGTFLLFLTLQYQLMKRSNLSGISKRNYILGESLAYGMLCLLGHVLLLVLSGGLVPAPVSYYTAVFSCGYLCSYAVGNLILGFFLQILLFVSCLAMLYRLKKKKDPTLLGAKRFALQEASVILPEESFKKITPETPSTQSEDSK